MTIDPSAPKAQGAAAPGPQDPGAFMRHTLPVGTSIGGLEITGLIGEGGFGIVYLAYDATLQRQVALKEYMPSSLASRSGSGNDVSVKSPRYADTFNAGLRSFVNEARLLAHFDHPALVKVHQFWQANRTAYMVMPYYLGPTLKAHLRELADQGKAPDEATLRAWLVPLLDALELMHAEQCYHRDIAPDNILLTSNGPLLLDFGAARRVISDMTHALTVMLKPGYAPIEQYGDAASMAQGPWTDLYALGSVVYFAITGHSPITSVERVMGDPLPALSSVAAGRYSATFLRAVDAALAVRPKDRPQSVAAFRALLEGAEAAGRASAAPPAHLPAHLPAPARAAGPAEASASVPAPASGPVPAPAFASPAGPAPAANSVPGSARPMPEVNAPARRGVLIGVLAAVVVAAGFGAAFVARRASEPSPEGAPAAGPGAAPARVAAPAVLPPAATPAPDPALSPAAPTAPAGPAAGASPSGAPANAAAPVPAAAPVRPVAPPPARTRATAAAPVPAPADSARRAAPPRAAKASAPVPALPSRATAVPRTADAVPRTTDTTAARPLPAVAAPPVAPGVAATAAPAPPPRAPASLPAAGGKPARCAEILQRGNQQTLSNDDIDFLRKSCR